jgi:hypothetical protein
LYLPVRGIRFHKGNDMIETKFRPLDHDGIATRIARDSPEGCFVNLGIAISTKVWYFVQPGRDFVFHAESGMIDLGPASARAKINCGLVTAVVRHVTLIAGAALVHHATVLRSAAAGTLIFASSARSTSRRQAASPTGLVPLTNQPNRSAVRWCTA